MDETSRALAHRVSGYSEAAALDALSRGQVPGLFDLLVSFRPLGAKRDLLTAALSSEDHSIIVTVLVLMEVRCCVVWSCDRIFITVLFLLEVRCCVVWWFFVV